MKDIKKRYRRIQAAFVVVLGIGILGCFWPNRAMAQVDYSHSVRPCSSVEGRSGYIFKFIHWVAKQERQTKNIALKTYVKADSSWISIQFDAFRLQHLKKVLSENSIKQFRGKVSGKLKIVGSCRQPTFIGRLTVAHGYAKLSNFGRQSFENVVIDTAGLTDLINRHPRLSIDVELDIGENFDVRNTRFLPLKIRLEGKLSLMKKRGQNVTLNGRLNAVSGFVKPFSEHFNLTDGSIYFSGSFFNPKIYFQSLYEPRRAKQDVKIWHIVKGTVEKPEFKFESSPAMKPKNMLSYTLFSQPFYKLDSVEQGLVRAVVNHSTADRTTEVFLNRMERIATQKLSVDVVRIDNTTAESGTVVTTGWYLSPKIFFAIQNVIAGRPKIDFNLEYYLTQDLKLILSQDNDYGQGIDLEWEYDY